MRRYGFTLQSPKPLTEEEARPLLELATSGRFSRYASSLVPDLERELAAYYGAAHAVTCTSGTAAVQACLLALDLPVGSEVVTTCVADIGVVIPILYENLVPVFADVDPETFNMTAETVRRVVTPRTSAVVAVHLAGSPCDMTALGALCDELGVALIEDFSQAHGATLAGRRVGAFGVLGCGSFQQSKHLSCGEGGVVLTDDTALAHRALIGVDKAWQRDRPLEERFHEFLAPNLRFNALQACVVGPQLRRLDDAIATRRRLAAALAEELAPVAGVVRCQRVLEEAIHAYYAFPAYVIGDRAFRDRLLETLRDSFGVTCASGYTTPHPLYLCANALVDPRRYGRGLAYSTRTYPRGTCPVAEELLGRSFLLPFDVAYDEGDAREIGRRVRQAAALLA